MDNSTPAAEATSRALVDGADSAYFLTRAEQELELAQRASHPGAVKAHYQLANLYLDRIYGRPR